MRGFERHGDFSPTTRITFPRLRRKLAIASRRSCSSCFHFQRGACSDSADSSTMGFNSAGALRHSQMCIRMCVASLNKFDSPDIALRADSVARASCALSFGIGASTPISRKAESISSGRIFVAPTYPVAAWLARVQGTVVTEVIIEPDGKADSVKFISAHPMFREPVETALKQWSFQPVSTATTLKVTIHFQLDADCPLTGSQEPDKRYYPRTRVSADLPSKIEVATCLPITTTINTGKS